MNEKNQEVHAKISKIGISKTFPTKTCWATSHRLARQGTQRDANHYQNLADWGFWGSERQFPWVKNWPTKTSFMDLRPAAPSGWILMGGSENSGTPKSCIWIGFSIINHPFWGTSVFGNTLMSMTTINTSTPWKMNGWNLKSWWFGCQLGDF